MRYVVTGAAGFIGSHLGEALVAGRPRGRRHRLLHGLLRPGGEGAKRGRARRAPARPGRGRARPRRLRRRLPSRRPAGRAQLRRRLPALRAPERAREPAGVRGGRGGGDARRLRLVVVDLRRGRALPDAARTSPPRPVSPYGITKLTCEHLARAYARSFELDAVVLRYFNAYGPRQRPDMAFPRIVGALAEGRPFTLYGDGEQSRSFTYVGDVVEATIRAMEGAAPGSVYNVGGGEEATLNETIALLERVAGRSLDVRPRASGAGRPAAHEGGHHPDRGRSRLGAANDPGGRAAGSVGVGGGYPRPRESPETPSGARSRRRAGGRPPLGLEQDRRALVAAGARARARSLRRVPARARRRPGASRRDARVPRRPVHAGRRWRDPEQHRDEPADRRRDRPLRGGAEGGVPRERHPASRSSAARSRPRR